MDCDSGKGGCPRTQTSSTFNRNKANSVAGSFLCFGLRWLSGARVTIALSDAILRKLPSLTRAPPPWCSPNCSSAVGWWCVHRAAVRISVWRFARVTERAGLLLGRAQPPRLLGRLEKAAPLGQAPWATAGLGGASTAPRASGRASTARASETAIVTPLRVRPDRSKPKRNETHKPPGETPAREESRTRQLCPVAPQSSAVCDEAWPSDPSNGPSRVRCHADRERHTWGRPD
mmetsp:Transcript_3070/g.10397  ORF Transcript_3070/g.10397 Transcript_3070/m.10397 type:complete len:232 (-) Transcript_3070:1347-2042(-)